MRPEEYRIMREQEASHWFYRSTHAAVLQALRRRVGAGASVCDAGCGTGGLLAKLMQRYDAAGVDLFRPAAEIAAARGGLRGRVAAARVEALPFPGVSFDALVCIDTLYHAQADDAAALREFRRVLRPGGWLIVQAAAFECLRGAHDLAVHTRRRFKLGEMASLVADAGFRVVEKRYRFAPLFLPLLLRRRAAPQAPAAAASAECASDLRASSLGRRGDSLIADMLNAAEAATGAWAPFGCSVFVAAEAVGGGVCGGDKAQG